MAFCITWAAATYRLTLKYLFVAKQQPMQCIHRLSIMPSRHSILAGLSLALATFHLECMMPMAINTIIMQALTTAALGVEQLQGMLAHKQQMQQMQQQAVPAAQPAAPPPPQQQPRQLRNRSSSSPHDHSEATATTAAGLAGYWHPVHSSHSLLFPFIKNGK